VVLGIHNTHLCGDNGTCGYRINFISTLMDCLVYLYMARKHWLANRSFHHMGQLLLGFSFLSGFLGHSCPITPANHYFGTIGINCSFFVMMLIISGKSRTILAALVILYVLTVMTVTATEVRLLVGGFTLSGLMRCFQGRMFIGLMFLFTSFALALDSPLCPYTAGCGTHWIAHAVLAIPSVMHDLFEIYGSTLGVHVPKKGFPTFAALPRSHKRFTNSVSPRKRLYTISNIFEAKQCMLTRTLYNNN